MLHGQFFKFSSRRVVKCPFQKEDFGIMSPSIFQAFDPEPSTYSDAEYFSRSFLNSFPDLGDRVRFANKFYQCFLCCQLPHKVRKLVVVGDKDSGKTTWVKVFFGLMQRQKIAVLTKEENFGAQMIQDDTELLWTDEWKKEMISDDLLKTMLQGGYFAQSIKHASPKMQNMQAGVYVTCNNIPDYGAEQVNIERRLYICDTKELEEKSSEAPQWIEDHAIRCLLWLATFINAHIELVEREERFYELPVDISSNAYIKRTVPSKVVESMKNTSLLVPTITPSPEFDNEQLHSCFREDTEQGNKTKTIA